MRREDDDILGYYALHKSWYAQPDDNAEIMFGRYGPEGGTTGEIGMRWHEINDHILTPRLEVYCDGWDALNEFRDLLAALAEVDDQPITPDEFAEILQRCGFEDLTQLSP